MADQEILIPCSSCERAWPRAEMFGVEPDLLCQNCRDDVSRRTRVRVRTRGLSGRPIVTFALVGLAAALYLLDHWIFGRGAGGPLGPAWWRATWTSLHAGEAIWAGQVHSLVTSAFFHGFFLHIFFNAWWVLSLGRAVESGFGRWPLLLLVLGGASASSACQWIAQGSGEGLSGVVYALALFLYVHRKTSPFAAAAMSRSTLNFLLMWLVLCVVLTQAGTWRVANWAHGGGAVWGWAVGQASLHVNRRMLVPLMGVGTVLLVVLSVYVAFGSVHLTNDETWTRARWRTYWLEQHAGE